MKTKKRDLAPQEAHRVSMDMSFLVGNGAAGREVTTQPSCGTTVQKRKRKSSFVLGLQQQLKTPSSHSKLESAALPHTETTT